MGAVSVVKEELLEVFRTALAENREKQELDALEGVKYFRLPRLYATPASGTVVLGENWSGQSYTGQYTGPNQGYVWSIRRLTANGLGTGTSPDLLNIYRNGFHSDPMWQLNGNNWGYSFGPTEMLLLPGEKLIAMSLGSLVSTQQVTLSGDAIEVPQAMLAKLVT
jgi:hypothetical protein